MESVRLNPRTGGLAGKRAPFNAYANIVLLAVLAAAAIWVAWVSSRPKYDLQKVHDAGMMASFKMLEDFPRQLELPPSLAKLRGVETTRRVRVRYSNRALESYQGLPLSIYDMSSCIVDSPEQVSMEANLLAAAMEDAMSGELVLVVGTPSLDRAMPVLSAAVANREFSGLRMVVVSDREDFTGINSVFGPRKINARSVSYRGYY